jgi:large subunit ribosomal protein L9
MEVILLKDSDNLGDKYDIVKVKNGFGRNYLIPQKMAIIANAPNLKKLDEFKAKEAAELEKRLDEFKEITAKLADMVIRIGAKAGAEDKIFGSVTSIQLAAAVKEQADIDIERKRITIPEEVKTLGTYVANVNLHPALETKINFEVFQD